MLEPRCRVVHAPDRIVGGLTTKSIFLAGIIDHNISTDWRVSLTKKFLAFPITILNPLRRDWTMEWKQDISFEPFRKQVTWELEMQELADVIVFYLAAGYEAPISMLELGLFAHSGKVIVVCLDGFWRKGNVQIVCDRYNVDLVESLEALIRAIQRKLGI